MFRSRILTLAGMLLTNVSTADVWSEREMLAGIKSELFALESLVQAAHQQSDPDNNITFNYEVLLGDIRKIQSGISDHLANRLEPTVPAEQDALGSNYTEHRP